MGLLSSLFGSKQKEGGGAIPVLPQDIYRAAALELQDIIAPSAIEIGSGSIKISDKICKTYFTMSYPSYLVDGWLDELINMDKVFDISIHINPIPSNEIMKEFQKKTAEVQSQILAREQKGMVRDPLLDAAYRNLEQLRDSLQQAQEKMFMVGLYITIYAQNEDELFKLENEFRAILESQMIYLKPALFQQEAGFQTTLPTGTDELSITTKLNTGPFHRFFHLCPVNLLITKESCMG